MKHTIVIDGIRYATLSDRGRQVLAVLKAQRVAYFKSLMRLISILLATAPLSVSSVT
jgi:hypothetical protein